MPTILRSSAGLALPERKTTSGVGRALLDCYAKSAAKVISLRPRLHHEQEGPDGLFRGLVEDVHGNQPGFPASHAGARSYGDLHAGGQSSQLDELDQESLFRVVRPHCGRDRTIRADSKEEARLSLARPSTEKAGDETPSPAYWFGARPCNVVRTSASSDFTIISMSSLKCTRGFQPSFSRALLASPHRWSTSVGR
jgi:hypothetical protein